jgi:hypothetical protein
MLAVTWTALGVVTAISLGFMALVKAEIGGPACEAARPRCAARCRQATPR